MCQTACEAFEKPGVEEGIPILGGLCHQTAAATSRELEPGVTLALRSKGTLSLGSHP